MNDSQKIQEWYRCDGRGCLIPDVEVEAYLLDGSQNQGIIMKCILCPSCRDNQFSIKEAIGSFPLLASFSKPISGTREITTPEFKRYEEQGKERLSNKNENTIPPALRVFPNPTMTVGEVSFENYQRYSWRENLRKEEEKRLLKSKKN